VGLGLRVITAPACDRFTCFAFEYAASASIDRLAVIHSGPQCRKPGWFFIGAFERLHPEFQNIEVELFRVPQGSPVVSA
jgi:hypothetical protein